MYFENHFSGKRERVLFLPRAMRDASRSNGMSRRPMHLPLREDPGDAGGWCNNLRR